VEYCCAESGISVSRVWADARALLENERRRQGERDSLEVEAAEKLACEQAEQEGRPWQVAFIAATTAVAATSLFLFFSLGTDGLLGFPADKKVEPEVVYKQMVVDATVEYNGEGTHFPCPH
jgi:hypothetical protein